MNNDIKEILDSLLDTINNLQEELFNEKQKFNNYLKEQLDYKIKIDKAIEYIEEDIKGNYFKRYDDEVYKMCEDLLDILRGENNG